MLPNTNVCSWDLNAEGSERGVEENKAGRREEMQIAGVMKAETLAVTHEQSLTDAPPKKHCLEDESVDSLGSG